MYIITLIIISLFIFVSWHFIPKRQLSKPELRFRHEPRAIASDPKWQTFINEHCESPAETAFLKAMIVAHELLPDNGSLKTDGLKLDFQVSVDRYRLDFLANNWLIIEIDGAAWHSSDEAKARDAKRDNFFLGLGYSVLRIPAKIVFNDPNEAVRRVNAALRVGKPVIAQAVQKTGLDRLRQTVSSANKLISELDASITRNIKLAEALRPAERAYHAEKTVIDNAIDVAEQQIKTEKWLEENSERKAAFESTMTELAEFFEGSEEEHKINIPEYIPPNLSGGEDIDIIIKEKFSSISKSRNEYFELIRKKIQKDKRLGSLVRDNLIKTGCPKIWEYIGVTSTIGTIFELPNAFEKPSFPVDPKT
ncbi:hypothetical protein AD940_02185 [Gluconobacter thailandicus]|uniref:DUF559 domain-containing protein n=1 Tax=Gluconobacter thailandicus TaxID=257438 RepID=UPI000776FFCD|nr:DUF559 domain-containing protein [Gluconobacter thailandicus]KXV35577.1 hypothetical protein AD940_02185 [Gluconobacter thailandicus]